MITNLAIHILSPWLLKKNQEISVYMVFMNKYVYF
jgi:hypothetical protein